VDGLRPIVRYLILCEDVRLDPVGSGNVTLVRLINAIRSLKGFPVRQPQFCVYVNLSDCRGIGNIRIEIIQADTGEVVFRTRTRKVSFGNDPLEVIGVAFRIRNCEFPAAGLYWVQFWYNGHLTGQQPIILR
jgi:hypothetical protein